MTKYKDIEYEKFSDGRILSAFPKIGEKLFKNIDEFVSYVDGYHNTHGMMEQAGNVLDGVVRLKARIAELEARNHELEEERRWRKCSEDMPSSDEGYFIALWEDKFPDIGYIGAEDDVIETIRDRGEGHSVEWWMPLPSAPKEGK
jgi:hypothetical protein